MAVLWGSTSSMSLKRKLMGNGHAGALRSMAYFFIRFGDVECDELISADD